MTINDWIDKFETNKDVIKECVRTFHPFYAVKHDLTITAPTAEAYCQSFRDEYASNENPAEKIDELLQEKNYVELYTILSQTWFGAPESTMVWNYSGFSEICSLLEESIDDYT